MTTDLRSLITIAQRVRYARHVRGLTQSQLAARAGLSTSTVQRIEAGNMASPRHCTVLALRNALAHEPLWLRFGGSSAG